MRRLLRRELGGIVGGPAVEVEAGDLGLLRLSVTTFDGRRATAPLEADDVAVVVEALAGWLGGEDVVPVGQLALPSGRGAPIHAPRWPSLADRLQESAELLRALGGPEQRMASGLLARAARKSREGEGRA